MKLLHCSFLAEVNVNLCVIGSVYAHVCVRVWKDLTRKHNNSPCPALHGLFTWSAGASWCAFGFLLSFKVKGHLRSPVAKIWSTTSTVIVRW